MKNEKSQIESIWAVSVFVTALMAGAVVLPIGRAAGADAVVIRAIAAWPVSCDCDAMYMKYIQEVNKRGKGRVQIRFLGGPEVTPAFEQFQALRTGIADLTHTAPSYFAGETVEGSAMDLIDPVDLKKYLKALRETDALRIINRAYEEKSSTRYLGITVGGTGFRFLMTKPIKNLDDLRGTRIRVFGSQGAKAVQYFGASPQTIAANELYTALQRGVVDGAIRAPNDAWSFGERDIYKTMVNPPLQLSAGGLFIATRLWSKLPQDIQDLLSQTAIEFEPKVLDYYAQQDQKAIKNLQKNGMNIVNVGASEKKKLDDARNAYWDEILAKSPKYGAQLRKALEPHARSAN
ncbi:MAG TPA: TRAP transporter substrate-binding protein DctP [Candidatus Binatia bacterium]|jgi:TRAP-type C4-dicarboxylate transport system substrate-binding protein